MKPLKIHTKLYLQLKLSTSKKWAIDCLLHLDNLSNDTYYDRFYKLDGEVEETEEQGKTVLRNGVGFSKLDTPLLTSIANQYREKGAITFKQYGVLFNRLPKYWKQYQHKANDDILQQQVQAFIKLNSPIKSP